MARRLSGLALLMAGAEARALMVARIAGIMSPCNEDGEFRHGGIGIRILPDHLGTSAYVHHFHVGMGHQDAQEKAGERARTWARLMERDGRGAQLTGRRRAGPGRVPRGWGTLLLSGRKWRRRLCSRCRTFATSRRCVRAREWRCKFEKRTKSLPVTAFAGGGARTATHKIMACVRRLDRPGVR